MNEVEFSAYILRYETLSGETNFIVYDKMKDGKTPLVQATEKAQNCCEGGCSRATVYQATLAQEWIQVVKRTAERKR